jgi:hypothetical protein
MAIGYRDVLGFVLVGKDSVLSFQKRSSSHSKLHIVEVPLAVEDKRASTSTL